MKSKAKELDGPYDQFCDSTFEHQDSIVSVEKNPSLGSVFLSGSKDGLVIVWTLGTQSGSIKGDLEDQETDLIKF